jgi:hypothetical protein
LGSHLNIIKNNNLIFAVINKKTEYESIYISRTRCSVYRNGP